MIQQADSDFSFDKEKYFAIIQGLVRLTQADEIMWSSKVSGEKKCVYNGKTFRLGCDFQRPFFAVNGLKCRVGEDLIQLLCGAIADQLDRCWQQEKEIDEVYSWFKDDQNKYFGQSVFAGKDKQ
jgi:hypothetical protein